MQVLPAWGGLLLYRLVVQLVSGQCFQHRQHGGCLADIAPTMLPYIGLPVPAEMTGKSIIVE